MNAVAIASIAWGILSIAIRGPLVFAPEGTRRVYLSVLETSARIRAMACLIALGGLATLGAIVPADGTLSHVLEFFSWALIAGSVFLLLLPSAYQQLSRWILEAFDTAALRMVGVLGVGIGVLLVYFGAAAA